jgi:hypothetical protein
LSNLNSHLISHLVNQIILGERDVVLPDVVLPDVVLPDVVVIRFTINDIFHILNTNYTIICV